MMIPNINCIHCKKGRCNFLRHVKECIVISGKTCAFIIPKEQPHNPPPPPRTIRVSKSNKSIETLLDAIEGDIGLCEEPMENSYEQVIYSIKALVSQFRRENNL